MISNTRLAGSSLLCGCLLITVPGVAAESDSIRHIEEVIVTAQRQAESLQEVPIAVTALTGQMLEDRQVVTVSDLQMNAPNVSFTPTNFGSNSFSIRGIGRLVTASTGDAGVSIHINEVAVGTNLNTVEFYDMERVEVLRGPQGTLYGKNATGGAVNFVTRMPNFDGISGHLDVEYGDYDHTRIKGAFNLPITDTFAMRFAGMTLDRDGYTDNLAHRQVGLDGTTIPGIKDTVDGREIIDYRITALWEINDNASAWLAFNKFDEDDDRARITNQVCVTGPLPTYGCLPDAVGFEQPHQTSNFFNLVAGLYGLVPLGSPDLTGNFNWPRPDNVGLRKMHTDFQPEFKNKIDTWTFGFDYDFDRASLGLVGGYAKSEFVARQDYNMDVGPEVGPNFYRADGLYPISDAAGGAGDDWRAGPCNSFDGTSGVPGGCIYQADLTRTFTFDQSDAEGDFWTVEAKLRTKLDGRVNFLVGASAFDSEANGDYYVFGNMGDARPDSYPGFFNNTGDPSGDRFGEGWAVFGEAYFDVTDDIKLTAGLRYNNDKKKVRDTSLLWNATDANFPGSTALGGFAAEPLFSRVAGFLNGGAPSAAQIGLIEYYGQGDALAAALLTPARSPERMAIHDAIPIVPGFNETRDVTGSPSEFKWTEFTGRLGVDWKFSDNSMAYLFYSRGYKPGGANPAIPPQFQDDSAFDFEQEDIDAWEVGLKTSLLDRRMTLNGALFLYDYQGLQVARIKNNSSLNENIDADIVGAELEMLWRPEGLDGLQVELGYSWLKTEVKGSRSVDPLDREGGNPDFITLNDFAFLYAARRSDITPEILAIAAGAGASVPVPGALYPAGTPGVPDGMPVIISRAFLNAMGVETVEGVLTDLDGNRLPNAPEHTVHLGLAYTWNVPAVAGDLTLRWDYYWQDDSYAREFNTRGDLIKSWDQHNASLIYEGTDGRWNGRLWIRNIQNEDNITGHYVTSDTSGYFRNYFLTEPRIYGASVRYNFGAR
jgi:iron complex outermembrane recepter protein